MADDSTTAHTRRRHDEVLASVAGFACVSECAASASTSGTRTAF